MEQLEPPDSHCFEAAQGWFGLGSFNDAHEELNAISPGKQKHPTVLELRWMICAQQKDWDKALTVTQHLLGLLPDNADSWLHHAYALRRATGGGLAKASAALEPAVEKFPKEPVIPYNLSCYACQLQKLDEAREWFQRALKVGKKTEIKRMALMDDDLKPLWEEIREL